MRDNKEIQSEENETERIESKRLNVILVTVLIILAILLLVNIIQHRDTIKTRLEIAITGTITTDNEEVNAFIENRCTSNCEKEYIANAWNRLENGETVYSLDCGPIPTNLFGFIMEDGNIYRINVEDGNEQVFFINTVLQEILDNYKDYEVHQNYINSGSDADVKPIIYIYNNTDNKNLQLSLTLDNVADKNSLVLYPLADEYTDIDNDSINLVWNITTNEDNTITASDNKEYSYIFWEAKRNRIVDWNNTKGFCVKGEDTLEFLQSTLSEIGLTPKEYNEMIVYWLPLMKDNKYNLITFAGLDKNDIYNKTTQIKVSDSTGVVETNQLRLFMITQPSDEYIELEAQEFVSFDRNYDGVTIVEWGGTQISR